MRDGASVGPASGPGAQLFGRSAARLRVDRSLIDTSGAVVGGVAGVGVSALLTAAARHGRSNGYRVHHVVAGTLPLRSVFDQMRAASQTAVLMVDDAHRVSPTEAVELRQLVLDGQLRCILGSTALDSLPEPLDWLWRSGQIDRIDLEPLTSDDIAEWITTRLDAPPDAPTLEALEADSGGRPGLLVDTLAALVAGADSVSAGTVGLVVRSGYGRLSGPLPCPPALRQRVAARQVGLSEEARLGLAFVCVTGRLDELSAATTVALPTVHELERHELVVSLVHRGRPVLVPSAGAIRRVVLAELGPIGVQRVAAQLLEGAPQGLLLDRELWAALASVDGPATPTIATIRQLIGDQRLDEAEALARVAAERGDGAATVALAELLAERGDRAGAGALLDALLDGNDLDLSVMVQATAELVQILLWNLDQTERAVALARSASDATGGIAGPAVPILLAVLAHAGRIGPAAELFEVMAGGLPFGVFTLGVGAVVEALAGRPDRGVELAERGLALCIRPGIDDPVFDPESQILARSLALTEVGRVTDAQEFTATWYDRARRHPPDLAWMALARSRVELAHGDLVGAETHSREAEGIFAHLDNAVPLRWSIATQLLVEGLRGDADACAGHLERLDAVTTTGTAFLETDVRRARAWALHAAGDTLAARRRLGEAALRAEAEGNVVLAMNAWHDALRLGERQLAPDAIERLAPCVTGTWSAAVLAHAAAVIADDPGALLGAAHGFAAAGRFLDAAESAAQALDLATRRGQRVVARKATAALESWRAVCPDALTPALLTLRRVELTGREREIATLAAGGTSSRRIAAELGISVRTVDNLLGRAFNKLGVRSRAELAAVLAPMVPR